VLMGLSRYYGLRGDMHTQDELAEELAVLAQRQRDPSLNVSVLTQLGCNLYFKGEHVGARARFDEAIALYDPERQHRSHVLRIGYDEGMIAYLFRSHVLWYLGYPTQAVQAIRDALRRAQNLAHPLTEVHSVHFSAWLRVYRREAPQAQEQAEAQLALSEEQGFSFFVAHATVFLGWALVQQGQGIRGLELIQQGLERYRATGALAEQPYLLGLLAEAYGHTGQTELGLRAVEEALGDLRHHGWPVFGAELFRLKGELLLRRIGDLEGAQHSAFDEAEECFGHALEIARRQQAKSLELRAAMSLGRVSRWRGKRNGARDLLANIYGWFTEGFDEPDLLEARALLDELTARGESERASSWDPSGLEGHRSTRTQDSLRPSRPTE